VSGRYWVLASPVLPHGHLVLGPSGVVIGREPSCAVRLHSLEVSRRHARIVKKGVGYTIEDLGSENGTFVNGRPVTKPVTLENDDVIAIATIQIQFAIVDGERDAIAHRFSTAMEETNRLEDDDKNALFAGHFTRESILQVCRLIELHEHSGVLRFESGGGSGHLRFHKGAVVEARSGPANGERAARSLLGLVEGDYRFHLYAPNDPRNAVPGAIKIKARSLIEDLKREEEEAGPHPYSDLVDETPPMQRTQKIPKAPPPS